MPPEPQPRGNVMVNMLVFVGCTLTALSVLIGSAEAAMLSIMLTASVVLVEDVMVDIKRRKQK